MYSTHKKCISSRRINKINKIRKTIYSDIMKKMSHIQHRNKHEQPESEEHGDDELLSEHERHVALFFEHQPVIRRGLGPILSHGLHYVRHVLPMHRVVDYTHETQIERRCNERAFGRGVQILKEVRARTRLSDTMPIFRTIANN